jgi:hypothetical protein
MDPALLRLRRELLAQARVRERGLVTDERAEDRVVVHGEDLREGRPMAVVVGGERHDCRFRAPRFANGAHRYDAG